MCARSFINSVSHLFWPPQCCLHPPTHLVHIPVPLLVWHIQLHPRIVTSTLLPTLPMCRSPWWCVTHMQVNLSIASYSLSPLFCLCTCWCATSSLTSPLFSCNLLPILPMYWSLYRCVTPSLTSPVWLAASVHPHLPMYSVYWSPCWWSTFCLTPPLSLAASTPILCISSPRAQPDSSTFTCSLHPTLCMFQSVCWCVTSSLIPPLLLAASTTPPCAFTSLRTQPHSSILLAASTPRYACTIPGAHDDVIKWKHFSRHWPFVRGIHRSLANFPHKGQWRGALMFSLICVWINDWVNNREAGDLRRYRAHYDVSAMWCVTFSLTSPFLLAASTPYFTHVPVPLLVCHKEDTCHQNCSVHPFRLHDWCAEVWHIGLAQ